jgi:hypothetical protein
VYIAELRRASCAVRHQSDLSAAEQQSAFKLLEDGLRLISHWTGQIMEQAAWKYAHPKAGSKPEDAPQHYEYSQVFAIILHVMG